MNADPDPHVSREAAPVQPGAAPSARKRSPQAEARRVAIPIAAGLTIIVAVGLLSGALVDRNALSDDSHLLSGLSIAAVLALASWGLFASFRAGGRAWREARARSECARGRLAGKSARPREGGGTDELSPPDRDLSRYRHMKWYHGGPRDEDR